jgi:hypothetical protein
MGLDGRINVDVLFHDTDGTASLKVVSLEGSTSHTTGKVAIVAGTCGTTAVTIATSPSVYRNASGSLVSFSTIERVAFAATPSATVDVQQRGAGGDNYITSRSGQVAVVDTPAVTFVYTTAGTASYTLVIYGT